MMFWNTDGDPSLVKLETGNMGIKREGLLISRHLQQPVSQRTGRRRWADALIHEGQYTPEELPRYKGWGHSSWAQAVEVAERAGVKRLIITHHDPDHNDAFLSEIERECQARFPNSVLAREKMEVVV